ncbi:restriction endonuclease subunit S [Streptomyces sp. NPDC001642]|uniref:restriction endonuclease subunit S n=1 Tax=Streptomyces sp. NPDC001642 TaxID=3154392 RepID=UPI00331FB6E4
MSASKVEGSDVGRAELPEGWAWATVADVGDVELGRPRHPNWHDGPEMRPYLRVSNVFEDLIDATGMKEMDFSGVFDKYRLEPGDILLNEGQSPHLVGRPAMYRGEPADVAYTNSLIRFRANTGLLPEWALLVFRNHLHSGRFMREVRITTNIAHLSATRLKVVEFPVPPTAEQHRITAAFDTRMARLDAIESKLRVVLDRVDRMWDVVLDAVATGVMPGVDTAAPLDRPVETVAEVRGGIQKQSRRRPVDNPYPFLRVANVGRGTLDLADVHKVELFNDEIDRYRLEDGDLLVVEGNGSADQIGRAATWHGEIEDCVHQNHLIRVRPGANLVPAYLEFVWNSPTMSRRLQKASVSTSGLYTLSTGKLKELKLPVATREDQTALVTAAQVAQSHLKLARDTAASALGHITALRRALLAEAFSGRLVAQDPADEPAEELLKRIRVERETAEAERKAAHKAARNGRKTTPRPAAPPPAKTDDTTLANGEQTTLPLEFSS